MMGEQHIGASRMSCANVACRGVKGKGDLGDLRIGVTHRKADLVPRLSPHLRQA